MLNYLSAELWRMRCRRLDLAQWMIFLLLAALAGWFCGTGSPAEALEAFQNLLPAGLYAALPLTSWAEGDAARTGLLTNEIVFGLPRGRIYLGKLFAAFLMGLLLFLFTALAFLGVALPWPLRMAGGPGRGTPSWLWRSGSSFWRLCCAPCPGILGRRPWPIYCSSPSAAPDWGLCSTTSIFSSER